MSDMHLKTSWQCVSALEYSLLLPLPLMAACRQFIASCVHSAGLPCSYTHAKAVLLCNRQTRPGSSAWAAAALTTAREQWEALLLTVLLLLRPALVQVPPMLSVHTL